MVTSWALLSSQLLELVAYVEEKGLKMPSLKRVTGSGDSVPLALQPHGKAVGNQQLSV